VAVRLEERNFEQVMERCRTGLRHQSFDFLQERGIWDQVFNFPLGFHQVDQIFCFSRDYFVTVRHRGCRQCWSGSNGALPHKATLPERKLIARAIEALTCPTSD
jgi:hypothetical protein